MGAAALWMVLLAQSTAAPTPAARPAASPAYFGASFGFQNNTAAAEPCVPPGNRGIFCGNASGTTPGVVGMLGVFIRPGLALEVEGSLARSRVGTASYDNYGHTERDITSGTYEHSDSSISALLRFRAGGANGLSFEPVIGASLVMATDSLSKQSRVITVPGYPTSYKSTPDSSTSRSAAGFIVGADAVSSSAHGVAFVVSVRIRWVGWPEQSTSSYNPTPQQEAPLAVGHQSVTIGAGIRFGGHQ